MACLKGASIRQRVERLIAIAHPDFRAELRREAEKLMLRYGCRRGTSVCRISLRMLLCR